jgi:uncharacterized protein with GYD domain
MENIKDLPKGIKESMDLVKSFGVKVEALVYTLGRYDAVVICDAPDAETVSKVALSLGSRGFVRTETLRGFTSEEMVEMVKSLP